MKQAGVEMAQGRPLLAAREHANSPTRSFGSTRRRRRGSNEQGRMLGPALGRPSSSSSTCTRPLTAPRPPTSHRQVGTSVRHWVFLPSKPDPDAPPSCTFRRPATARAKPSSERNDPTAPLIPSLPRRPHTSRTRREVHSSADQSLAGKMPPEFVRVVQESAQREAEQEEYVDPLLGRGVELRIDSLLPQTRATTSTASNLREQHRARAFQARARGDYHLAIQHFEKLLELTSSDQNTESFIYLAVCYERVGQLGNALQMYLRAAKADQENPFVYYNMGNIHMRMGAMKDAIACFTSAIQHGHTLSSSYLLAFYRQRGAAYRKNGEFERAAQDYVRLREDGSANFCRRSIMSRDRAQSVQSRQKDLNRTVSTSTRRTEQKTIEKMAGLEDSTCCCISSRREYSGVERTIASHGFLESSDPYEQWTREKMVQVSSKLPLLRTEDDLVFLTDYLQARVQFCATLHHEVCLGLARSVKSLQLFPGQAVYFQHGHGSRNTYIVCDGRVSAFITRIVPLCERENNQQDISSHVGSNAPHESWESSYIDKEINKPERDSVVQLQTVTDEWRQTQMHLCDLGAGSVFGNHGRLSGSERSYSVIATSRTTLLALSWRDLHLVEQAQLEVEKSTISRFLRMTSLLEPLSPSEIDQLALRARPIKIVGSKVLCSEGQFVDGLLIVKEGELCQLNPSGLPLPPDLSITFSLSGTLNGQNHEQERSALEFFTQLEHADDPLGFIEISRVFHGFLPNHFVSDRVSALSRLSSKSATINESKRNIATTEQRVIAKSVRRGEFFCASSSWIPYNRASETGRGVSCAKSALVTRVSSEVLFFSAHDLIESLSESSRIVLHRQIQQLISTEESSSALVPPTKATTASTEKPTGFVSSSQKTSDLIEQAKRDASWNEYKHRIMQDIVADRDQRRRGCSLGCQSAR